MATTKKRVSLNLSQEDLRILNLMETATGESVNILVKKALLFYWISRFETKEKK